MFNGAVFDSHPNSIDKVGDTLIKLHFNLPVFILKCVCEKHLK